MKRNVKYVPMLLAAATMFSSMTAFAAEEGGSKYPIVSEPITVKGLIVDADETYRSDRLVWNEVSNITGINIEWESIDSDSLSTYLASNDWPDFFQIKFSTSVVADYGVTGERFVDISEHLDDMPNLVQTFKDYPALRASMTEIDEKMYGLSTVEKSVTAVGSNRPYVRTDVLEEAGVELPETVDEFYEACKKLKEYYGEPSYVPDAVQSQFWTPMIYTAFGPEVEMGFDADEEGNVYYNYTSDQMKQYLQFMNKLYEEGLVNQEFLTLDKTVRLELAKSGKVAFIGGVEAHNLQAGDFKDGEFHISCGMPLTSDVDDTRVINGNAGVGNGSRIYINKDSEYVDELCKMFDIMYASEEVVEGSGLYGISFCYGMEGKDWDFGPEGSGTYTFHTPDKYNGSFSTYQYGELIWANMGRQDALAGLITDTVSNNRSRQIGFAENVCPYMKDTCFPVSLLKFNEDEQYVLDNKLADINSYISQMKGQFITGAADLDKEWDKYCSTLKDMGIDDITEVYQSSYDRWQEAIAAAEE